MGPIWVLSAPDGPHVSAMNFTIKDKGCYWNERKKKHVYICTSEYVAISVLRINMKCKYSNMFLNITLQWCHNERDCISNNRRIDCLLNHLFRRRLRKTWKLRVTGLCAGNSSVNGEFPAQRARNAENVSIWWRHHVNLSNPREALI